MKAKKQMGDMKNKYPSETFLRLLNQFSDRTRDIIDGHFTLVLKILFFKYKRKVREYEETLIRRKRKHRKRKYHTGPLYIKTKDVSDAMMLVDSHLSNKSEIDVYKHQNLVENFGEFLLEDALRWYDEYLLKGTVRDFLGRRILFTENGKKSFYKEHTPEGAHVIEPENYVQARGKRLSWIKPLLAQTKDIYREVESSWETFIYIGIFKMTIDKNTIYEKEVINYFLIITRRRSGQPLEFITAYYTESQQELFKHLERARPLTQEQRQFIIEKEKKH